MKTVIDRENRKLSLKSPSGVEIYLGSVFGNVAYFQNAGANQCSVYSSPDEAFAGLLEYFGLTEHEQTPVDKKTTGLYNKFNVTRTDGSDAPGGKHEGCEYFVLDLTHDPFAIPALRTYADVCAKEYPALSADLIKKVRSDRKEKPVNEHVYTPLEIRDAKTAWMMHNFIVAMQAAYIEFMQGEGSETDRAKNAMQRIINTLSPPGHLPGDEEMAGVTADEWYEKHIGWPFKPGPWEKGNV